MSLHINMTEEAAHEIALQHRRNKIAAAVTALLGLTLLGIALFVAKVVIPTIATPPEIITYNPELANEPVSNTPITPTRPMQRPPASSNSNVASIITTSAMTDVAVTTVDPLNEGDIAITSFEPGTGIGGPGDGEQGDFGSVKKVGSTLEGTFYDFKQTQDGSPTGITPAQATALMREFVTKKWDDRVFSKYFKSPTKLYSSQFYISLRSATEAPKAYQCADRVKDSRWCAVYRGKVMSPKSGKFRFVGAADDNVTVRFNNENVFDYGFYMLSLPRNNPLDANVRNVMSGKVKNEGLKKQLVDAGVNIPPVTFYQYTSSTHWNNSINGVACGKTFEVKAGEVYPIEILITEIPGGRFGVALLLEEIGLEPARRDSKTKAPVLPLFRTNYSQPSAESMKSNNLIPFDPIGIVWQAVNQ